MKNLAGVKECDEFISHELELAGIHQIVLDESERQNHEVPFTVIGLLGATHFRKEWDEMLIKSPGLVKLFSPKNITPHVSFIFCRAWYYWIVTGFVPLHVAEELYADPIGKKDVRVSGHCGCPAPKEWIKDRQLIAGHQCVESYHIDSQEGLNLFVRTLRAHSLVDD
jgi:hypothetical protein